MGARRFWLENIASGEVFPREVGIEGVSRCLRDRLAERSYYIVGCIVIFSNYRRYLRLFNGKLCYTKISNLKSSYLTTDGKLLTLGKEYKLFREF